LKIPAKRSRSTFETTDYIMKVAGCRVQSRLSRAVR